MIVITPIAHGQDVLLQRAPPTTDNNYVDPLYMPIPIPRSMDTNLQARAASLQHPCMAGTLPAVTTNEPIKAQVLK